MNNAKVIQALKKNIIEEQKAVKLYTEQLQYIDDKQIIDAFDHIISEEKEHEEKFKQLLKKIQLSPASLLAAIEKAEELGIDFDTFSKIFKSKLDQTAEASDIWLIRHGETPFNTGDSTRIRSIVDLPLDDEGLLKANQLGIDMKDSGLQCIYTSDMCRALQTSRALELNTGSQVEIYKGFRSWNLGSLAGKSAAEVEPIIQDLLKNPDKNPPGSNESYNKFLERNIQAYYDAIKFDGKIAIVSHHSNLLAILQHLEIQADIRPGESIKVK